VKIFLQLFLLQEFAIITVVFSGVFLLVSYVALTWTTKMIPPEMLTLAITLISGSGAAAIKKGKLSNPEESRFILAKQSLRDYAFIGAATTQAILTINYVFLVWLEKAIPVEISVGIGSLAASVLGFTDFGGDFSTSTVDKSNPKE
jgi:hypothetical protein